MEYVFFLIYVVLIFWRLPLSGFMKKSGISPIKLRWLLFFKMTVSLVVGYYFFAVLAYPDYISNHQEANWEYEQLMTKPWLFFTDFKKDIGKYGFGGIFDSSASFWGYLNYHLLAKLTALLNVFTKGNFYLNTAVFSSITFLGHIAFYRVFSNIYPDKKTLILVTCFALPSLLLYTSCIHKDGIIFLSIALASLYFYQLLHRDGKPPFKLVILIFCTMAVMLLFRNYILVALIPAMFVALLVKQAKLPSLPTALVAYVFFAIVFFATGFLNNSFDLPAAVVKRKADFALLEKGRTNLQMPDLQPNAASFLENLPTALNHSLLRPYPFEFSGIGSQLSAFEIYFYLLLTILFLITRLRRGAGVGTIHPFNVYGLAFFISIAIIIGLVIPNVGAIIRYRSIFLPFLLCPVAAHLYNYFKYSRRF